MLSRAHRFHGYNALNFAHRQGQIVRGSGISLKYVRSNRRQTYRVAVIVSKKVSKSAVTRNRIRRRVYESFRVQAGSLDQPLDLILQVYNDELATMPVDQLQKTVGSLLRKAGAVV